MLHKESITASVDQLERSEIFSDEYVFRLAAEKLIRRLDFNELKKIFRVMKLDFRSPWPLSDEEKELISILEMSKLVQFDVSITTPDL